MFQDTEIISLNYYVHEDKQNILSGQLKDNSKALMRKKKYYLKIEQERKEDIARNIKQVENKSHAIWSISE